MLSCINCIMYMLVIVSSILYNRSTSYTRHIKYSNAGEHSRALHPSVFFERCGDERAWKNSTNGMNWRCAVAPGSSPEMSWNSKLAVRFARKWSSDTELWHWPLCDEPVHGWQKNKERKLNEVQTQTYDQHWPIKLRMIHPHDFAERNYGLGHG